MQVKKVLQILDVVDNLPSDIRHMLYEEDTSMDMTEHIILIHRRDISLLWRWT